MSFGQSIGNKPTSSVYDDPTAKTLQFIIGDVMARNKAALMRQEKLEDRDYSETLEQTRYDRNRADTLSDKQARMQHESDMQDDRLITQSENTALATENATAATAQKHANAKELARLQNSYKTKSPVKVTEYYKAALEALGDVPNQEEDPKGYDTYMSNKKKLLNQWTSKLGIESIQPSTKKVRTLTESDNPPSVVEGVLNAGFNAAQEGTVKLFEAGSNIGSEIPQDISKITRDTVDELIGSFQTGRSKGTGTRHAGIERMVDSITNTMKYGVSVAGSPNRKPIHTLTQYELDVMSNQLNKAIANYKDMKGPSYDELLQTREAFTQLRSKLGK